MEKQKERVFGSDNSVVFIPDGHRYVNSIGEDYMSTTKLIKRIVPEFPRFMISKKMAEAKFPGASEEIIKIEQAKILKEWDEIAKNSQDHGTGIHSELEQYDITGQIAADLEPIARKIRKYYENHHKHFNELLLYSDEFKMAGTTDKAVLRSGRGGQVVDFGDYKTNNRKEIQFDSSSNKNQKFSWNNKYLLEPFDHIEHCNYWEYALQLSLYGYYAESTYGIKVGKLDIFFIDRAKSFVNRIPVPYMRLEAKALLEWHKANPIKETKSKDEARHNVIDESGVVKKPKEIVKTNIIESDWDDL